MKATPGRIVMYQSEVNGILPAVVQKRNPDDSLDLNVFTGDMSNPVELIACVDENQEAQQTNSWHWPPREG